MQLRFWSLVLIWTSACAPTVHQHRVSLIRSAAIIGFSGEKGDDGASSTITTAADRGPGADLGYQMLAERLTEEFNWKVLPASTVMQNTVYQEIYNDRRHCGLTGLVNKIAEVEGPRFQVRGILWGDRAMSLDSEERERVRQALGVDAVIVADLHIYPSITRHISLGSHRRHSYLIDIYFHLYDGAAGSPAWADSHARGGAGAISAITPEQLTALHIPGSPEVLESEAPPDLGFLQSVHNAYAELLRRYRSAQ